MYIHTYNEIGDRVFKSILFLFIISQDIQGFTRSVVFHITDRDFVYNKSFAITQYITLQFEETFKIL